MGAIEKTLDALDGRVGGRCQVVAICGRNKALIERLSNRSAFASNLPCCMPSYKSGILYLIHSNVLQVIQRRAESEGVRICDKHGLSG